MLVTVRSCIQRRSLSARCFCASALTGALHASPVLKQPWLCIHHTLARPLQGMQELHKAAPQTAGGEADPETQQAVQRVFNLVRNGTSGSAAKDCNLTLDDVVRFYNVSVTPAHCAMDSCTMARAWYFTLNHQHTQRAAIFMHNQDVCEDLEKDDSAGVGARAGCCSVAS